MARLRDIVIDARHPAALARFWAAALAGYAIRPYDEAEIARLAEIGLTPETDTAVAIDGPGPTIFVQQWAEGPQGRSALHLDLAPVGSRSEEVARLCALGATVRDERPDHTVLLDPEGHAFCVLDAG